MAASLDDSVPQQFAELMRRVRSGCPEAIRALVEQYGREIHRFVRWRMHPSLRAQFDSLDFTQDAWASFFHLPPERYTFQTERELRHFLVRLAQNKLHDAFRGHNAQKRNRHATEPFRPQTDDDTGNEPAGREPTPSQLAIAEEEWDHLVRDIPPRIRQAMLMLRQGYSQRAIARQLGVPVFTLQRVLRRLKDKRKKP